ncbi:MAG: DUF308 domain-containing protein [Spirochaetaceae bacterium]|nr:DUF308 domain-containing protein [Spirochaetaceae bacterium]
MSDNQETKVTIEEITPGEKAARHYSPLLIIKGIIGLIAGIVLLFWPKTGLAVVAVTLGIFLTADGIERLITILRFPASRGKSDVLSIIGAILRILFGAIILFNPVQLGGFWVSFFFIVAGINLISGSLFMFWTEPHIRNDLLSLSSAVLMLFLGLLMIILPLVTALLIFRILGSIMILTAVPSLAVGLRSR